MRKYYDGYNSFYDYEFNLTTSSDNLLFLYHDVYFEISNFFEIKKIFEPYKYFSVQSISSWYEKMKSINSNKNLQEKIKNIFEKHGITL